MSAKLLVLGIDAANPQLLERWIAEGALPNIAALSTQGLTGETRNVADFYVGATWPSLCTGLTPARHGIHYIVQLRQGSYRLHPVIRKPLFPVTPFWTALSRAGKQVAVLDVPLSRLDPGIQGMQVVEWGGHDAVFGFGAAPPGIAREIEARFGPHPHGASCDADHRTGQDYATFIDRLCQGARLKGKLTGHFLRQRDWDFFMQVFTEAHCAGHQCWHLHDTAHPAHDAAFARAHGDPLRRVYTAIDAAIGEVVEHAGDARVVVFTAHGMGHWFGAQFLLDEILVRLGVAQALPGGDAARPNNVFTESARRVWRALPGSFRRALQPVRAGVLAERTRSEVPELGVDAARSACFAVPNGFAVAGIRLNLIGREPHGILQPGPPAHRFCDELAAGLLGIVDERTGGPLIKHVVRTADLFTGTYLDQLPDLLVEWSDVAATGSTAVGNGAGSLVRTHSRRIGTLEGSNHYGRTGEHRPHGLFIASGHGITHARMPQPISILDFAPSFTRFLGVELRDCEGQAVAELL